MKKSVPVHALIGLLDDSDEFIFNEVSSKLIKLGVEIIPILEEEWESSMNEIFQERIENIIQTIQFNYVKKSLVEWTKSEQHDLLEGFFIISKHQYPNLDFQKILDKIEPIIQNAWLELNNNLTALEKVRILNHIIFDIYKFSRNTSSINSPENFYLNYLLDEKRGNPLSLSIIYAIVAQKLNLPIYGVDLPKNFILAYKDEDNIISANEDFTAEIIFYINPYNKGAVFGRKEIEHFLNQQKLEYSESYFSPCSNLQIIQILIQSLMESYEKLGYPDKVFDLSILLEITSTR
jgi:regulator of sirC expression with transglutaminase-like and TPR domain